MWLYSVTVGVLDSSEVWFNSETCRLEDKLTVWSNLRWKVRGYTWQERQRSTGVLTTTDHSYNI
jgi:hypothetical protein